MIDAMLELGFVLRDLRADDDQFEFLGFLFLDGSTRRFRHTAKRTWRLFWAIQRLLGQGEQTLPFWPSSMGIWCIILVSFRQLSLLWKRSSSLPAGQATIGKDSRPP